MQCCEYLAPGDDTIDRFSFQPFKPSIAHIISSQRRCKITAVLPNGQLRKHLPLITLYLSFSSRLRKNPKDTLLPVNVHTQLKIIGYLLGTFFCNKKREKKTCSAVSQDKNLEANNTGFFPLRVHITTVVCWANVLQTRFIMLRRTIETGGADPVSKGA